MMRPLKLNRDGSIVSDPIDAFCLGWQPTAHSLSATTFVDYEETRRVAKRINSQVSQCYFNARKAILKLPEYATAIYVEGWAICNFPIEHGWIVKDGKILDPTLGLDANFNEYRYFPGLEFHGRKGIEEFLATSRGRKCKRSPFFFAFGWGGMDAPGFRGSWDLVQQWLTAQGGDYCFRKPCNELSVAVLGKRSQSRRQPPQ